MLVRDLMTLNPCVVRPESDPLGAMALMKARRCRHMPVVDEGNHVIGIVTRADIQLFLSTSESPGVIKRQHRVQQMMTTPVFTTGPDCPIEEAARKMIQHQVSGLPVVEEGQLVGIITKTDIFKQLVESLGGDIDSIRLTVQVPDTLGQLALLTSRIAEIGGNIVSVITARPEDPERVNLTFRVTDVEADLLLKTVKQQPELQIVHTWTGKGC